LSREGRRNRRGIGPREAEIEINIIPNPEDTKFRLAFESAMDDFIAHAPDRLDDLTALVFAALFFEGVGILDEAIAFAHACSNAVRVGEDVYVGYLGVRDRPRCHLASPLTLRLLSLGAKAADSPQETAEKLSKSPCFQAFKAGLLLAPTEK
jgi:hypothetical protein